MHHVEWFMTMASEYGIKEEEDVYMRSFVLHLGGKDLAWFVGLDKGTISTFTKLVEMFCNHWDSGIHDEWIPHVKHAKELFSNEAQNKYQFEEGIVEGLTDDILRMMDEAPQEYEYNDGLVYDDPKVLIEEAQEHEDRMRPPFQHTKNPCDILDLWEHNNKNSEDDGYWTFMGLPSLYDSS